MGNFKEFTSCILQSVSALIQALTLVFAITLPIYCGGNNQISLTNSNGWHHTCVVWYGQPTCWGRGTYTYILYEFCHKLIVFLCKGHNARLGQGSTTDYGSPPSDPISLNGDFVPVDIVMGSGHSCSLSVDGRVACWGYV